MEGLKMKDKLWFTTVQFSHLTRYFAVGAVVRDQNDWLMYVKDISTWPERDMQQLHAVERVKRHFGVSGRLLLPPTAEIDKKANLKIIGGTIPTVRFPSWVECQNCHLLYFKPWLRNGFNIDEKMTCPNCMAGNLEQVTWCATSSYAGLTDVPWHDLCHRGNETTQKHCRPERNLSYLKLALSDRGRRIVECTKCGSSGDFEQTDFVRKVHVQPGTRLKTPVGENQITYTVMEVNDPRVYNASNERALVIPPESNIDRNSLVYRLQLHSQMVSDIKNSTRAIQRRREIKKALRKFRCTKPELLTALDTIDSEKEKAIFVNNNPDDDKNNMASAEYEALTTQQEFNNDADFITRHLTEDWCSYIDKTLSSSDLRFVATLVNRIVAVDRLRVIEVFKGFQRAASDYEDIDPVVTQNPDFSGALDWLPAIELFGEVCFLHLIAKSLSSGSQTQR
jgi:hypothetical protein